MKLKDYLTKLKEEGKENLIISVGAKGGSSYIYIAEVGKMNLLKQITKEYKNNVEKHLKKNMDLLKSLYLNAPELTGNLEKDEKKINYECENVIRLCQCIKSERIYLKTYKPIFKREIVEIYDRISEDGITIIVEGKENGPFWTKCEFDKKYC